MLRLLILAQNSITSEALRKVASVRVLADDKICFPKQIVDVSAAHNSSELFCELSGWINQEIESAIFPSDHVVVMVDAIKPSTLNPIGADIWNATIAMLILAFPEVYWIFGSSPNDDLEWEMIRKWHCIASFLSQKEGNPLFDGSGLRHWVRRKAKQTKDDEQSQLASFIPIRNEWAAAVDDETSYAYLNAYICYRYGFRSWAVNSNRLYQTLFGQDALPDQPAYLTFEDFYLGFKDKDSKVHYAKIRNREGFEDVRLRHFVTTGHQSGTERGPEDADNRQKIHELKASGCGGEVLFKPTPGIFTLWRNAGLDRQLDTLDETGRRRLGVAPGFIWPPCTTQHHNIQASVGHSAPGRLLQISEYLIERATRLINDEVDSVPEAVRGAVMASSAQELLGDRTPTTARDALELKQRFEVNAECQFGGVEVKIDVKPRFAEIEEEMLILDKWFSQHNSENSYLNGSLAIISRLLVIYRNYDEFVEAEECRCIMRRLEWKIARKRSGLLGVPSLWLRAYIENIIVSTPRMLGAIMGWILFFWVVSILFNTSLFWGGHVGHQVWLEHLAKIVKHFIGGDPSIPLNGSWTAFGFALMVSIWGFLHVGILISHIYRLITRA